MPFFKKMGFSEKTETCFLIVLHDNLPDITANLLIVPNKPSEDHRLQETGQQKRFMIIRYGFICQISSNV